VVVTSQPLARPKNRCYLVYALASPEDNVRRSNHLFNDYISDSRRGLCVYHDHFVRRPGGIAIFDVRGQEEAKMLDDPGPLEGWELQVHGLDHSLTAVGFAAQMDHTLQEYGGTTLAKLAAEEVPRKRHWWTQRK
jgi:hypothetical protein